jgi:hypothetical protein
VAINGQKWIQPNPNANGGAPPPCHPSLRRWLYMPNTDQRGHQILSCHHLLSRA